MVAEIKKKSLSILLAVAVAIGLFAATPLSATAATGALDVGGRHLDDLRQDDSGLGWRWSSATNTIALTSAFTGNNIRINCNPGDTVNFVYTGDVKINNSSGSAIECNGSMNINGSGGRLTISSGDTAIHTGGDLTIRGGADIAIDSRSSGITAGGGVSISGSTVDVSAVNDGISSSGNVAINNSSGSVKSSVASTWAVKATGSLSIGGNMQVMGYDGADYTVPSIIAVISGHSTFASASAQDVAMGNLRFAPLTNASINPLGETFDKSVGGDITFTINSGSYTMQSLRDGSYTLKQGIDYTSSVNAAGNIYTVTLKESWLKTQIRGTHTIFIGMSDSRSLEFGVIVIETAYITPTEATFEKNSGSDITVTLNRANNNLQNIKNGFYILSPNTDYTAMGTPDANVLTYSIKASYLNTLAPGVHKIVFNMNTGMIPTLTVTVTDASAPGNAVVAPAAVAYDKNIGGDIAVTLSGGSYSLQSLKNGDYMLISGADYDVVGSGNGNSFTLTLRESYLKTLTAGVQTINVNMSGGANPALTLTVADAPATEVPPVTEVPPATETPGSSPDTVPGAIAPSGPFPFTDIVANAWYYNDVRTAWQTGLIDGRTPTAFSPDDNLTYAEAVKLAACMHELYTTGVVTLQNGSPWYQSYVDYARANGIISGDQNWNAQATRAGYMGIFANALPAEALAAINNIPDGAIPDVPISHPQAAAIYKLYRAGILQGVDSAHNCNPNANIRRSEVAAILTRMMTPTERINFSM